jgi:hypothetical protein
MRKQKSLVTKQRKAANKHNHKPKQSSQPVVVGEIDPSKFYRRSEYGRVLFGAGKTALKDMVERGDAPPFVVLSDRIIGWFGHQILAHREKKLKAAQVAPPAKGGAR